MSVKCPICQHKDRLYIEEDINDGAHYQDIVDMYQLDCGRKVLSSHARSHMGLPPRAKCKTKTPLYTTSLMECRGEGEGYCGLCSYGDTILAWGCTDFRCKVGNAEAWGKRTPANRSCPHRKKCPCRKATKDKAWEQELAAWVARKERDQRKADEYEETLLEWEKKNVSMLSPKERECMKRRREIRRNKNESHHSD